jgi:hypothetical protein
MARDVWGIPIPDAKDVVSYINSAMNTLSIASGDKPALTPGANAVRQSGKAVSYVNSSINPFAETSKKLIGQAAGKPGANKALAKSVGVDAAVALTAALGGKAVTKGAQVFSDSRQVYYGIHGSPISNLKKLEAQTGRNTQSYNANISRILGGDQAVKSPKVFSYRPDSGTTLAATDYAQRAGSGTGSLYVVKTKAKNILPNTVDTSKTVSGMDAFMATGLSLEQMSSKAMKVVKEFPMSNYTQKSYDAMEGAWETTQKFSRLFDQVQQAIQSDKKNKLVRAIENTGLPARIANTVKRETVLLHGSPKQGLNVINPRTGSARFPDKKVSFGWNTKSYGYKDPDGVVGRALEYTGTLSDNAKAGLGKMKGTMPAPSPAGSIYITKGKQTKNVVTNKDENFMMAIRDKMPIIKEFKISDYTSSKTINTKQLAADVKEGLKLAGVKTKPNVAEKLLDKAEAARIARRTRERNKNSPV